MKRRPNANGANGGRDIGGRFTRGNPGGPGNPYARRVAALRSALLDAVGEADVRALAVALLKQAKGGDVAAAKLVLAYAAGVPREGVDPDRLDWHELDVGSELILKRSSRFGLRHVQRADAIELYDEEERAAEVAKRLAEAEAEAE